MADWLVEEGIAEQRAVRMVGDQIVESRIWWPGELAAGWIVEARLAHRAAGTSRGTAIAEGGEEILVSGLAKDAREGAAIRIEITRSSLRGPGRFKRAQGRPSMTEPIAPDLAGQLRSVGETVEIVRRFPGTDWDELIGEALEGRVSFSGGELLFAPTPAMLTVDIDGDLVPRALAMAAVGSLAGSLRRFAVGGSVAVDFPTLAAKDDRRAIDAALGEALAGWPHERTAMNGFGLVQIVARLERASLLHRAAWQRSDLVWRRLLRQAETLSGAGRLELTVHPSIQARIQPEDVAALERRCGRRVSIVAVASQVPEAPHAQLIAHG